MVEKVFISPNRVRAYGNIMNMKTGDDFTLVNSELTVTTDTVNGAEMTVFQIEVEGGISIALVSSASTCNVGDNVLLTATVLDDTSPVEAAEVTFKVGETVLGTDETDANGVATYTYSASTAGTFSFTAVYQDSTSPVVSVSVNHSYSLSFSQSSYVASGGSVTLECTLLEDNVAMSGASVTVTGSDGSVYNGITNSQGIASVTVSVTGETIFTATYSNVSDTCTVTVSSYLFYDDCTSDRSSEYTNASIQTSSKTNYLPLTYNSNGYYIIKATSNEGNHYAKWIPALDGLDNIRFSCEVSTNTLSDTNRFGLVVGTSDYKSLHFQITSNKMEGATFRDNSYRVIDTQTISSLATNTWYKMEYTVQGTSYTFKLADMSDNVLYTKTGTFSSDIITVSSTKQYGLYYLNYGSSYQKMFRNIKAESL